MGKFDGVLICTDLDGTLLKNDKTISRENLEAISYFKQEGGYFTFITGRMPFYVSYVIDAIKPNAPFGCVNGAGLYDADKGEYVWHASMPDSALELVAHIDQLFPDVGIQVNTYYQTFFCKDNDTMVDFRKVTGLPNLSCHYRDVPKPLAKVIFGSEHDAQIRAVEKALKEHPLADTFSFIRSERALYEILPKGIHKGTSIQKLCDHLGLDIQKTIALGDYNNDIPMLQAAGMGIAVSNACEDALKAADLITVSNEEHAIAKVICDLENKLYCL